MTGEPALRELLVRLARKMLAAGLVTGTSGNLSAREPGSDRVLITPSGVDYETIRPEDLVAVGLDGQSTRHGLTPSVDLPNHLAVYRARPEVNGVVHTHSPYAAAFSVVGEPVPSLLLEAAGFLGGAVRPMDYVPPGGNEAIPRLVAALAGQRAVLLPNHGVLAIGETLPKAFHAAIAVEEGARVAWLVRQLGRPRPVPDADVAWMNDFIHHRYGQR
jgi:ribulose-5-phosphate 4-epimerase/fuculose-1-phosphate aldolase